MNRARLTPEPETEAPMPTSSDVLALSHSDPCGLAGHLFRSNDIAPEELPRPPAGGLKGGAVQITLRNEQLALMPMHDFLFLAFEALTQNNLEGEDDPRLAFIEKVKQLEAVPGYGSFLYGIRQAPTSHQKRLGIPETAAVVG